MRKEDEREIHKAIVDWMRFNLDAEQVLFWHTPNGVSSGTKKSRMIWGQILKAMGVRKGFPDLCMVDTRTACEACGTATPIGLEVKKEGAYQQPEQKIIQNIFEQNGWPYHVIRSTHDLMDVCDEHGITYREVRFV